MRFFSREKKEKVDVKSEVERILGELLKESSDDEPVKASGLKMDIGHTLRRLSVFAKFGIHKKSKAFEAFIQDGEQAYFNEVAKHQNTEQLHMAKGAYDFICELKKRFLSVAFVLFFASLASSLKAQNVFVTNSTQTPVNVVGPTGTSATQVRGVTAHDAAATENPVFIGVYASTNIPSGISSPGDKVQVLGDNFGRIVVLTGSPYPEKPKFLNVTASGETVLISSPGASSSLYINKIIIQNRASTNRQVSLKDGSGGTIYFSAEVASEGGATAASFGARGWKLAANTQLIANLDAAGDVDFNVTEWYLGPSNP